VKIITLPEIQDAISKTNIETLIANQESAFVSYSQGMSVVPPVGHLDFVNPPGECHIKYGYIISEDTFAIKVATGFYHNVLTGLPSGDGLILLFNAKTCRWRSKTAGIWRLLQNVQINSQPNRMLVAELKLV
jgi:ornithine cyclodeaminase